ncbi:hypothetical protein ABIC03_005219 [Bradyrhizobium sp. RT6a]|uniref:hypothetical protein n=1 Tax=Bradyrhizobium sp. RT6a TaxID=3156381 RepID=UPI0033954DEF
MTIIGPMMINTVGHYPVGFSARSLTELQASYQVIGSHHVRSKEAKIASVARMDLSG